MKTRDEIQKELREIAPQLSQLPVVNPYTLPDEYFTAFSAKVMERIALGETVQELKQVAPSLSQIEKPVESALPDGYFKNFSAGLLEKIRVNEVTEELKDIAPTLSSLQKVNAYEAPEEYFKGLATRVIKETVTAETRPESAVPGWVTRLNAALDGLATALFKPAYSFAMAGGVAVMVIVAMVVIKPATVNTVECATGDLLCMLEKENISDADLETYFATHPDEFGKSVLDISTDDKRLEKRNAKGDLSLEEYLQSNISDEELNNAILN